MEYLSLKRDPLNPQKRADAHFEEFSRMLFHARRREPSRSRGKPSERKAPDRLSRFNGGVLLPSGRWIGRAAKNEFLFILSTSAFRQTKSAPSMSFHGRGCVISREKSQRISMPSLIELKLEAAAKSSSQAVVWFHRLMIRIPTVTANKRRIPQVQSSCLLEYGPGSNHRVYKKLKSAGRTSR